MATAPALDDIDLSDLEFWLRPLDERAAAFATLRGERPIAPMTFPGLPHMGLPESTYWSLTRHADIVQASRHPELFCSGKGTNIADLPPDFNEFFGSMINMDDPRHARMRRIVSRGFTPRQLELMKTDVEGTAAEIVDEIAERGEADFVTEVAARLPLRIILDMMGIPRSQEEFVFDRTNVILGFTDPEYVDDIEDPMGVTMSILTAGQDLAALVTELGEARVEDPGNDLVSALVNSEVDGEKLTASLPPDTAPADLDRDMLDEILRESNIGDVTVAEDPESGEDVLLKRGPFGPYLQLGVGAEGAKPKRVSLPPGVSPHDVNETLALELIGLPKTLGQHPESGENVDVGIGRYGPYVKHQRIYASVPKDTFVLEVDLPQALELLSKKANRGGALRELGEDERSGHMVDVREGRFGPYVKRGKVNASLPKDLSPDDVTFEQAMELLDAREVTLAEKGKGGNRVSTMTAPLPTHLAEPSDRLVDFAQIFGYKR